MVYHLFPFAKVWENMISQSFILPGDSPSVQMRLGAVSGRSHCAGEVSVREERPIGAGANLTVSPAAVAAAAVG